MENVMIIFILIFSTFTSISALENEKLFSTNNKFIDKAKATLSPVIFVPGDGGCQIEAKWSKPSKVLFLCVSNQKSWTILWLSYSDMTKYIVECFVDNFRLIYDAVSRKTHNSPGVNTRVPGFGFPDTIEYIDPYWPYKNYFGNIGSALIKMGYVKNVSLRGAPYDFRKAPNELQDYYEDLKKLIEDTYDINNNLKVTLIVHSLGGPVIHYFLVHQDQNWKDKYIQSFISLSGAWAGSVKPLKVYAMGDSLGTYFLSQAAVRPLQISLPSLAFLVPSRQFWDSDEVLIQSPEKNITLANIEEFFSDLNFTDGFEMYKDTRDLLYNAPPPGVEVHCLHGVGVPTTDKLIYNNLKTDFPTKATLHQGDGDGTVNIRSLEACLKWKEKQKAPIYHETYPKIDHMQILFDKSILTYIIQQLQNVQRSNSIMVKKRHRIAAKNESSPNSIYFIDHYHPLPSSLKCN